MVATEDVSLQWKTELDILGHSNFALISHGLQVMRSYKINDEELAVYPVLSCLALGFEQSCKAVLLLARMAEDGESPTKGELTNKYRHNLQKLKDDTVGVIHKRMGECKHNQWIDYIYELVSRDKSIDPFIGQLSNFGSGGRYHSLNILVNTKEDLDKGGPWLEWANNMDNFIRADSEYKDEFQRCARSQSKDLQELRYRAKNSIADKFQRFYDLLTEAGIHHLLGDNGEIWCAPVRALDQGLRRRMDNYRMQAMESYPEQFQLYDN